jgi:hypothetical protein
MVDLVAIEQQIKKDSIHQTSEQGGASQAVDHTQTSIEMIIHKHPYPLAMMNLQKLSKRLRKPD